MGYDVMTRRLFEKSWKVGGAAGITSMFFFLVSGILVADEPAFTYSGKEIVAWYVKNGDRWLAAIFLIGIAYAFLFLPFLSALTGVLASAEGQPPVWSRVAAMGGLLYVAVATVGPGGEGIVSYLTKDVGADQARAGMAFALFVYSLTGLFAAAFVMSASAVILQTSSFWRWLGWYGFAVAVVNIIGAAAIFGTPDGLLGVTRTRIAPPALAIWIVAASVGLLRMARVPRPMTQLATSWQESTELRDDAVILDDRPTGGTRRSK